MILQYTLPTAAWKISYRLRETDEGPFELQGFTVVDNNTEEDWKDCLISVVTGEPITSPDLADSKIPHRGHVNVGEGISTGSRGGGKVVGGICDDGCWRCGIGSGSRTFHAASKTRTVQQEAIAGGPDCTQRSGRQGATAKTELAEVHEVGDFCVFESPSPVSIDANRSAVVPVFHVDLRNAKSVLHYKASNHSERPYRAIQFLNRPNTAWDENCTVYQQGN